MDKVEEFAFNSFAIRRYSDPLRTLQYSNLENGRVFSHILSVDISGDSFEVPVFASELAFNAKLSGYSEVAIPLFNNSSHGLVQKKMVGSILKDFMNINLTKRLLGVEVSNGHIYYGCPGLILDENFNPLLMTTFQIDSKTKEGVVKCICRISQSVLSRQDESIPKAIYKKIVPLYCTKTLDFIWFNNHRVRSVERNFVEVIFCSSPGIVVSPVLPTPEGITDDVFDKILNEELVETTTYNDN